MSSNSWAAELLGNDGTQPRLLGFMSEERGMTGGRAGGGKQVVGEVVV